jgi:hypothetical protein
MKQLISIYNIRDSLRFGLGGARFTIRLIQKNCENVTIIMIYSKKL